MARHTLPARLEHKVARLVAGSTTVVFTIAELATLMMVTPGVRRSLFTTAPMLAGLLVG